MSAGDVILAEWVEENVPLKDTITKVVQCAFKILHVCKSQRREHNSKRPIRIGAYIVLHA